MDRKAFGKVDGVKPSLITDNENFQKVRRIGFSGAERTTCDNTKDIRETSVRQQDCFTPSGRKVVESIIKSSEKPKVAQDAQLHSDTTIPGELTVEGMKKGGFTTSAEKQFNVQKDKKVPAWTREKALNS